MTTPKFMPRAIRLDGSDTETFPLAAAEDEWAVSGAFIFADAPRDQIVGKWCQAFKNGFLCTDSFGWSTFVVVASIDAVEFEQTVSRLAHYLVEQFGAPDLGAALPVAREEAMFAASICDQPPGTLISVERELGEDGVREKFRTIHDSRGDMHAHVWAVEED